MEKKYRYNVSLFGEEIYVGTIDLTKNEAEIVAYATNKKNWKNCCGGNFCGDFWIDIDNPIEIEE